MPSIHFSKFLKSEKSWDIAAGLVLVREAGGYVSDADGGDGMMTHRSVCAGNEAIHRGLLAVLRETR